MSRYYDIGGKNYVSMTTFLDIINKPGLVYWHTKQERQRFIEVLDELYEDGEGKMVIRRTLHDLCRGKFAAADSLKKASDFGNRIHTAIECYLRGDTLPPLKTKKTKKVFKAWKRWWDGAGFDVLAIEKTVWDDDLETAGTVDLYAKRKRKRYVIDWKSGKSIWPPHMLQNIGYRHMAKQRKMPSDGGILVHIPQDGSSPIEIPVLPEMGTMDDVRAALKLWRWEEATNRLLKKKKYGEDEIRKPS